jgi:hypothetical protein
LFVHRIHNLIIMQVTGTTKTSKPLLITDGIMQFKCAKNKQVCIKTQVNSLFKIYYRNKILKCVFISNYNKEIRLAIESKTAELAALNSTEQDINDLNNIMKLMESAYKQNDFEQYHKNDFNFHLTIAKASKNVILYKILEIIQDLLNYSIIAASEEASFIEISIKLHKLIINAITNRDPEKAAEYMVTHLNGGMNYLKK